MGSDPQFLISASASQISLSGPIFAPWTWAPQFGYVINTQFFDLSPEFGGIFSM